MSTSTGGEESNWAWETLAGKAHDGPNTSPTHHHRLRSFVCDGAAISRFLSRANRELNRADALASLPPRPGSRHESTRRIHAFAGSAGVFVSLLVLLGHPAEAPLQPQRPQEPRFRQAQGPRPVLHRPGAARRRRRRRRGSGPPPGPSRRRPSQALGCSPAARSRCLSLAFRCWTGSCLSGAVNGVSCEWMSGSGLLFLVEWWVHLFPAVELGWIVSGEIVIAGGRFEFRCHFRWICFLREFFFCWSG